MQKTTVYLPDTLKSRLTHAAHRWGKSEADLIRSGIERELRELAKEPRPRPRVLFDTDDDPTLARRVDEALAGFGE